MKIKNVVDFIRSFLTSAQLSNFEKELSNVGNSLEVEILLSENNFDFSKENILSSFNTILRKYSEEVSENLLFVLNILSDIENNNKIFSDIDELYNYVDNTNGSISIQLLYQVCDDAIYLSIRLDSIETGKISIYFSVIESVFNISLKRYIKFT